MNYKISLIQFLTSNYADISAEKLLEKSEFDESFKEFCDFLKNTIVIPGENVANQRALSELSYQCDFEHQSYNDFINKILHFSMQAGKLKFPGINDVSRSGRTTSNPSLNFQVNVLRDKLWARLCTKIGKTRFIELLTGNNCFMFHPQTKSYACLFESKAGKTKRTKELIYNRTMFYRWRWHHKTVELFDSSAEDLTRYIYGIDPTSRNIPKKYRKVLRLLKMAKNNEKKLKYDFVFANIVQQKTCNLSVFKNSSVFKDVIRFVFVVIDKTFPGEIIGCSHNKKVIRERIVEILSSHRLETFEINFLMSDLLLSTMVCFGKSHILSSAQDKTMRQEMLLKFLIWFFGTYLYKLVKSFWYVTDFNNETVKDHEPSAFYPHAVWNRLSGQWLSGYVEKYLIEISDENHIPSKYNHGILRLIPKKLDFRPLCVPVKHNEERNDGRRMYDRDIVLPVRDILRNQQRRVDGNSKSRCYSVRDICANLTKFTKSLLEQNSGVVPKLYGLKFDMKHCYDNLNQAKIIECIEKLFEDEDSEEKYYVRHYLQQKEFSSYRKVFTSISKRKHIVNFNIFDNPPSPAGRNVYSDQCRTTSFTRGDILDIVKDHVLNSTIEMPQKRGKLYTRRIGVFQGFPLLATFCDIVYNSLVDYVLSPPWNKHESILLRLADDFLFLSTRKDECDQILRMATSKRAIEYGAFINREKCCMVDPENPVLHFVGLELNIQTMNYRRNKILAYKTHINKSFKKVLSHIEWSFNLKVNDFLLDTTMVTKEAILDNVRDMMSLVFNSVKLQMPKIDNMPSDEVERLKVFILSISRRTLFVIKYLNYDDNYLVEWVGEVCAQEIKKVFGDLIDIRFLTR